jgi:hypothetical protein
MRYPGFSLQAAKCPVIDEAIKLNTHNMKMCSLVRAITPLIGLYIYVTSWS